MFKLEWKNKEWVLIYTQEHSTKDISYIGDLLSTVRRVRKALLKDELFSIIKPNMADTLDLLGILGEIEKCTSWNMFEVRETEEIVNSLVNMLLIYDVYNVDGVECQDWIKGEGDIMRNPERIKPFLKEFEELWLENSDLRFGQLVFILADKMGRDMFFPEEEEWSKYIKESMK